MKSHLRRIATAGNAVAVGLLVIVLANQEILLGPRHAPGPFSDAWRYPERPEPPRLARRVLLVVIDGFRSEGLENGSMPHLARSFRREWISPSVDGESWIPSTVAGIRTIVEGRVHPPASFLQDFGASRSLDGGMFAVLQNAGLRAYAAGPRLWADLYGPWLAGSFTVPTVGNADGAVLQAGLNALDGDYDLVVVHLSGPDDAAHLYGGDSREYWQALRRADTAAGRLLTRTGPNTAVLVTADHQVTDRGGHAGLEAANVPVLARGPGMSPLGESADQRSLPFDLLRPLGLTMELPPYDPLPDPFPPLLLAAAALVCGWALLRRLPGLEVAAPPTLLNAAFWVCLALAFAGWGQASLILGMATLATTALMSREARPALGWRSVAACGAGMAFGLLRLADTLFSTGRPLLPATLLLGVAVLAFFLGRLLGRSGFAERWPLAAGLLCGILPAVLGRLQGETASLADLDVRLAFRLADGPLGLPGAVLAVVATQALPTLAVLFGLGPALVRSSPTGFGGFAAGLGITVLSQGLAAALGLALGFGETGSPALGLLVRLIGETTFLFLGSAAVLALGGVRKRPARSRIPAATPP